MRGPIEKERGRVCEPQQPIKTRMGLSGLRMLLWRGGAAFRDCVESQRVRKQREREEGGKKKKKETAGMCVR